MIQVESISRNAEKALLDRLDHDTGVWSALYCQCSKVEFIPDANHIVLAARTTLAGKNPAMYFFANGDLVITWVGAQKIILEGLRKSLSECLHAVLDAKLDTYYDSQADSNTLRQLCRVDIASAACETLTKEVKSSDPFASTQEQKSLFQHALYARKFRSQPEILVVEDQPFSLNLLRGLLDRDYKTYTAATASAGWERYLEYAPDITLLDIELPDADGHRLAGAIMAFDPKAYIVMVTANHYAKDVEKARVNGAKGFIVKPYNKQKILESIKQFQSIQDPKRKTS